MRIFSIIIISIILSGCNIQKQLHDFQTKKIINKVEKFKQKRQDLFTTKVLHDTIIRNDSIIFVTDSFVHDTIAFIDYDTVVVPLSIII